MQHKGEAIQRRVSTLGRAIFDMDQMLAQLVNIIGDAAMWLAFEQATILNLTQWRHALLGLLAYEFTNDKNTNNTPKKKYAPSSDPREPPMAMDVN